MNKAIIITGHYGSGKTNIAVNLALEYAQKGERVCVADLDIVNPYFRTADFSELFAQHGVRLAAPKYANTNLDIPALGIDMYALLDSCDRVVVDAGGDDAGAVALGQYARVLKDFGYDMLYVVNRFRLLTHTASEAVELLRDIERVSQLKVTGVINNSNLGRCTAVNDVLGSVGYAEECAAELGVPLLFTAAERSLGIPGCRAVGVYVRPFWEE